jgi:outer membrane protein TolC
MLIKNYPAFPEKALKFGVAVPILSGLMAMCLFCSCSELETTSPQDYIGAATQPPQPNIKPPQEAGKTQESGAPTTAPSTAARIESTGPLSVTINEAVLMSLEKNKSLVVQKLNPQIKRTVEQQAISVFDPDLTGTVSRGKTRLQSAPTPGAGPISSVDKTFNADASLSEFLPTGTLFSLEGSTSTLDESFAANPFVSTRLGASVTQSLLRGFGPAVNLVAVNQAKIDTSISQYELRGFVESLVAQVEETYWSYSLAEKSIEIFKQSMRLAEDQQKQTEEQIRVGTLAASELAAARAEVALRRQDLIVAENTLAQTRLNLLRLLNPDGPEMWNKEIILQSEPETPTVEPGPVQPHVERGLQMRPEMNQARLQLDRDELELIRTRNGLLPQLDFFITLGKTGYADSFGDSTRNIFKKDYDALAGISFEYPPINRSAQAKNRQAILSRQQAQEAIDNLGQLVEVDIRGAYLQITSVQQQVAAAKATRELQEEKLKVETEKFNVGKSTSILVAQAQRDFLQSQIAEIQAIINYQIAVVELYRLEGTLLLRSGITSPGGVPVKISKTTSS